MARRVKENAERLRSELKRELQGQDRMGGVVCRALTGGDLSAGKHRAARICIARVCPVSDKLHYLHTIGAADDYNFESFRLHLEPFVRTPFFAGWWLESAERFSDGFRASVDGILAEEKIVRATR